MSEMKYVSDVIDDKYEKWGRGDIILLTAPTGTGKSHFVLYDLLKWAIQNNQKILYVVNRKILKAQIKAEIKGEVSLNLHKEFNGCAINIKNHITVTTYQSIERRLKDNIQQEVNWLKSFWYVVYDECHYFYSDANFNTSTELSYDCLRREFFDKVQIFISATMRNMERMIKNRGPIFLSTNEIDFVRRTTDKRYNASIEKKYIHSYELEKDYSYLDIHTFEKNEELLDEICSTKTKWLIFMDNIEKGKELRNSIITKGVEEKDVGFIDANYEETEDSANDVKNLVKEKFINKRIVISTAVMDNGISFMDSGLRNIVILADTEESFIQMLGRKREDGNSVKLYICVRDVLHFSRRKSYIDSLIELHSEYSGMIDEISTLRNFYCTGQLSPYAKALYLNGMADAQTLNIFWSSVNLCYDMQRQEKLLDKIMCDEEVYKKAVKMLYVISGRLAINSFAITRLTDLQVYYANIIKALENDRLAFIREQLKWLEIDSDTEKKIIAGAESGYRECIRVAVEELCNKGMNVAENKEFKKNCRDSLEIFLRKSEMCSESTIRTLRRTDDTISPEMFNEIMKKADLPYTMHKEGKSTFIIERVENKE